MTTKSAQYRIQKLNAEQTRALALCEAGHDKPVGRATAPSGRKFKAWPTDDLGLLVRLGWVLDKAASAWWSRPNAEDAAAGAAAAGSGPGSGAGAGVAAST